MRGLTRDEKKRWLEQYIDYQQAIRQRELELEQVSKPYITDREVKIKKEIAELERKCEVIEQVINSIPNVTLQNIFRYKYIMGWTWEQIGDEVGYSERQLIRARNKALDQISVGQCH